MLECRHITAQLGDETVSVRTTKGCPQGGVLSPLLWSIVMDKLMKILSENGFEVIGYADDLTVMVRGKDEGTLLSRLQTALTLIWDWCKGEGLSINPSKTTIIPFTRKKKLRLKKPKLNGTEIEFSKETKYLGVILDQKLTWNPQISMIKNKCMNCFMACKMLIGKKWGLKPSMIKWLYVSTIRPIMTYAAFIWWPKTNQKKACKELTKVQRIACLAITGAMKSTPTIALEAILNLAPVRATIIREAALTAFRIGIYDPELKPGNYVGHLKIYDKFMDIKRYC